MNSSIFTADRTTHLRIVATAFVAAALTVWIAFSARGTGRNATAPASAAPVYSTPSMLAVNLSSAPVAVR